MKTAVVLCSGAGTKIWPYSVIRNKCMIPISNRPVIQYTVDSLKQLGFSQIVLVTKPFAEEIRHHFHGDGAVSLAIEEEVKGTAFSLLCAERYVQEDDFLVLYGDTILEQTDIEKLISHHRKGTLTALVSPVKRSSDHIGAVLHNGRIEQIMGHAREDSTHFFAGFAVNRKFFEILSYNAGRFTQTEVGMMSPVEGYLEMSLYDAIQAGEKVYACEAQGMVFDIDKPWHILEANDFINRKRCMALTDNSLAEGAVIDRSAYIDGFVKLGKNSKIGKNVIIEGNIIAGDNTVIKNGAILKGNTVVGNETQVLNGCYVEEGSTIGNRCYVGHCAELSGMIFNTVYLYHYMEINGILGENVDIGAATVCGSLRFDDTVTPQKVKGRREGESPYSDSVFLGDYCRTGVNAILMPGVKVGAYSIVGAGVNLACDLNDNTILFNEQTQTKKKWGFEKYGW